MEYLPTFLCESYKNIEIKIIIFFELFLFYLHFNSKTRRRFEWGIRFRMKKYERTSSEV